MNKPIRMTLISIIFQLFIVTYPSFTSDNLIEIEEGAPAFDKNKKPELLTSEPLTHHHLTLDVTLPIEEKNKPTFKMAPPSLREIWEERISNYQIVSGSILEIVAMPSNSLGHAFGLISTIGASASLVLEETNPYRETLGIITLVGSIGSQVFSMIGSWAQKEADKRLAIEQKKNKMISQSLKLHFQGNAPSQPIPS